MVDPVTQLALRASGPFALKRVQAWLKGSEFDRLLEEVADRLNPEVGVLALAPLREDEAVVSLVIAFLRARSR
jgi:hypothetical protein